MCWQMKGLKQVTKCFDELIPEKVPVWPVSPTRTWVWWGAAASEDEGQTVSDSMGGEQEIEWTRRVFLVLGSCVSATHSIIWGGSLDILEIFHPPLLLIHCVYFTSSASVSVHIPHWEFLSFWTEAHSHGLIYLNFPFPVWGVCLMNNRHQTHAIRNKN